MLVLSKKEYYDFTLSTDILFKSQGVGGIAFRMRDEFNYYAFLIDKNLGHKAIVKVQNNKVTILKQINDGGILTNNWHTVTIKVKAGLISVYIYDKEKASKSQSEKKIEVEDYTFAKGTAGFFVNSLAGFFFDEFQIKPLRCFSPWQPNPTIEIHNIHTNIYTEDFSGNIYEKYTIIDIEESNNREGPSSWSIINDYIGYSMLRQQTCLVHDASASRRPTMALLNYINFQNGIFKVVYNPSEKTGMVSVILKYNREEDQSMPSKEEFYTFDIVNEEEESYFTFRKWSNGNVNLIKRFIIDQNSSKLLHMEIQKAYLPRADNWVHIEFINQKVTIKISQNGTDFATIFNLFDESIRAGTVGFGTYKTCSDFRSIYVQAPRIKLTQKDIEYIMIHTIEDIPMPSVVDIYNIGITSSCSRDKIFSEIGALNTVMAYSTILGSTLGNDFCGSGSSTTVNNNNYETTIIDQSVATTTISEGNQWKVCVVKRSPSDRNKYCNEKFDSDVMKMRCQVSFIFYF